MNEGEQDKEDVFVGAIFDVEERGEDGGEGE